MFLVPKVEDKEEGNIDKEIESNDVIEILGEKIVEVESKDTIKKDINSAKLTVTSKKNKGEKEKALKKMQKPEDCLLAHFKCSFKIVLFFVVLIFYLYLFTFLV